jgi:hypothetical protein
VNGGIKDDFAPIRLSELNLMEHLLLDRGALGSMLSGTEWAAVLPKESRPYVIFTDTYPVRPAGN